MVVARRTSRDRVESVPVDASAVTFSAVIMEVLVQRSAGLDVHQAQVTACVRISEQNKKVTAHTREFATTPAALVALREWLTKHKVTHIAMEGTGVYWLPVYTALEPAGFDLTLCNAHHVKNVPGRKTDKSDAAWLAQLLASGLLRKSFVPPAEQRMLREMTRARVHRVEDRARVVNTLHRQLERIGIKLCSVVSDLTGMTARGIMRALVDGVSDVNELADLARGSLRLKRAELAAVLAVPLNSTERFMIGHSLELLDLLNHQIIALDARIEAHVIEHKARYEAPLQRMMKVPGLQWVSSVAILAEIGADVGSFDNAPRLAAWAGLAPGSHESAGKRKRMKTREGNGYVRRMLVQCAMTLVRAKKPCALRDFLKKKMVVLGFKKAAVATAHKLLVQLWTVLRQGVDYAPLPPPPLTESQRERRTQRYVKALEQLGNTVSLQPRAA